MSLLKLLLSNIVFVHKCNSLSQLFKSLTCSYCLPMHTYALASPNLDAV